MTDNRFISVSYELFIESEDFAPVLVEKTHRDHCFEFVTGLGFTLPDFEAQVGNLNEGDKFDFVIPKDKAYGLYDEQRVKELPKDIFKGGNGHFDAETIYPGNVIPMTNEDGMRFNGIVKEVKADSVVIDFNHELAGMDLHFRGEVVKTHEATAEEISKFVSEMSCGCDEGCDGNCGGDHSDGHCCGGDGHKHGNGHCGCGHCH